MLTGDDICKNFENVLFHGLAKVVEVIGVSSDHLVGGNHPQKPTNVPGQQRNF
jgi:hypothetical protein